MAEIVYPYTSIAGYGANLCRHEPTKTASRASFSSQITSNVGDAVRKLQDGPLTMAVSAGNDCWRFYKSGILSSKDQCPTYLDHAVLAVGFETEAVIEKQSCRRASKREFRSKKCEGQDSDIRLEKIEQKSMCCTYSQEEDVAYWLLQNSWGTRWGLEGFIKIEMESGIGVSGVNQLIEYVTVAENEN